MAGQSYALLPNDGFTQQTDVDDVTAAFIYNENKPIKLVADDAYDTAGKVLGGYVSLSFARSNDGSSVSFNDNAVWEMGIHHGAAAALIADEASICQAFVSGTWTNDACEPVWDSTSATRTDCMCTGVRMH